jgi:hypothetical protein
MEEFMEAALRRNNFVEYFISADVNSKQEVDKKIGTWEKVQLLTLKEIGLRKYIKTHMSCYQSAFGT